MVFNGSKKDIFVGAIFIAAVCILGIKLLNSTSIQIFLEDGSTPILVQKYFTYADVVILTITSLVIGISGTYLLLSGTPEEHTESVLEDRKNAWKESSKKLVENEQKVYEAILEADGITAQSEIVQKTQLSKASVSRSLDLLESKGLVERKRRGMGNIVLLK